MIDKIILENYRCYKDHSIKFSDLNIAVGKNNAGKSTLIEALRLTALVTNKYKQSFYQRSPSWANLPKRYYGISPSLKGISRNSKGIFYRYSDPPAKISVLFQNKSRIEISLGENDGEIYAALFNEKGNLIEGRKDAQNFDLPTINILPQIGPLKEGESLLNEDYVRASIFSNLSSIHFRNQLQYFEEYFSDFRKLAEGSWDGLSITKFEKGDIVYGNPPLLFITDNKFTAEIGLMGHGLQMWLQTMWFIARCDGESTVILDEPDVYLHADMQRKLIRFLKDRFKQIIIATHSVEIISDVEPENILVINKDKKESKLLTNLPEMQGIISTLGSIQNIELTKNWLLGRLLYFESDIDDPKIMQSIQNKLFPESTCSIDLIPKASSEGWTGWHRVVAASKAIEKIGIKTYCVFDSDFHLKEEVEKRYDEAKKFKVNIHIWNKKEIENYLIVPAVILRVLTKKHTKGNPTLQKIDDAINRLTVGMKDDVVDSYSNEIKLANKELELKTCNQKARKFVDGIWEDINKRLSIIPGKIILGKLSEWSMSEFGTSFSKIHLIQEMRVQEIDKEMIEVVTAIEKNQSFINPYR
ncbi:ATP-dependent endonuclease [candidate division WS5 bacterium]|uniref:ATP-dependent endonuclease n=1 Tax=candidate division WS5 bacterium TaxID=2093353 RepID=A0A419DBQ1_9BACT|nr:MAG: ATP-dependent endonuclease [candidate division WS5 bacterium]